MASGSVPGCRAPTLIKASEATARAKTKAIKTADELNLGLLVEYANKQIIRAANDGRHATKIIVPEYIAGASAYDLEPMRDMLGRYLQEQGGYDTQTYMSNILYVQWLTPEEEAKRQGEKKNTSKSQPTKETKKSTSTSNKTNKTPKLINL